MTAFIFDFDGTLVNSETAIYQCFIEITKQLAPDRIEIAKNILIGPPLRETAAEILGLDHQDKLNQFFKDHQFSAVIHFAVLKSVADTILGSDYQLEKSFLKNNQGIFIFKKLDYVQ